jgi:hypothetical protein
VLDPPIQLQLLALQVLLLVPSWQQVLLRLVLLLLLVLLQS